MADKSVKFRQLAEKRMSKIIKGLRQIGNLASRSSYEYTPEQIKQMFSRLREEIATVESRFNHDGENRVRSTFTFDEPNSDEPR